MDSIEIVQKEFESELTNISSVETCEQLRIKYLGKKGNVSVLMESIKTLPTDQKPVFGQKINYLKNYIGERLDSISNELKNKAYDSEIKNTKTVDLSEIDGVILGSLHPVTIVQKEIEDIFNSMGFFIEDGSEVVDEFDNFEAVNVPADHPARDMQDTFWLENGQLLKTQTSAMQNKIMRKYPLPLKVIFPGRCFRNESVDASHDTTFFQMEGIMIDENISIANLKYFMQTLLEKVLKEKVVVRLRPGYFPFVEPGFELDIQCKICGGKGCPTCKNSGWLELLPCGMIHPRVLEMGGIDTKKYQGFAFGLGLTRLAMMKYGIKDVRDLNSGNLKVLKQFQTK